MFDYEWATLQHTINCRLARSVVVPDAIPPERLRRYGAAGKLRVYAGIKEEYYLADFEPDAGVPRSLGLDPEREIVVVRPPPEAALYHRFENDLFAAVLDRLRGLAADRGVQAVVLPRTGAQREALRDADPFVVPAGAIDAQSLIAHSSLVVSAGGTMNREAAALGKPVYTTFGGRVGAVDEELIRQGRLRRLSRPDELVIEPEAPSGAAKRVRRDPRVLVELLLTPLAGPPPA
jgi:predicted glycosyltransferase